MPLFTPQTPVVLIARGGSSDVYRFVREDSGEPAVLKCLIADAHRHAGMSAAFAHERRLLESLNGTGFPKYFQSCEYLGRDAIVMQGMRAEPLSIQASHGHRSIRECLSIVTQVLASLAQLHSLADDRATLHAVHRDVTPANVLLDEHGKCTLVDLGLASSIWHPREANALTEGTTGYCAPELYTNEGPIDARVDVFSAGVLLWELLAGKRLYPLEKFAAMSAILDQPARSILSERADLPAELAGAVHLALERDPQLRCKNAGGFDILLRPFRDP